MANGSIPFLTNIDLNYNQAKKIVFEVLATDPTGTALKEGRYWYNSTSKLFKFYDGSHVVTLGHGTYIPASEKGSANGVAPLGADSKVDAQYLPSYVDDVKDSYIVTGSTPLSAGWLSATEGGSAFTPETDKIYVILSAGDYQNRTFRWSGTTYVEISPGAVYTAGDGLNLSNGVFSAKISEDANGLGVDSSGLYMGIAYVQGGEGVAGAISGNDIKKLDSMALVKAYQTKNPSLTVSGGVATWNVTHGLDTQYLTVQVYEVSTGNQVMCDVTINNTSPYVVTIKFVSSSNISADTYRVHIIGFEDTSSRSEFMH